MIQYLNALILNANRAIEVAFLRIAHSLSEVNEKRTLPSYFATPTGNVPSKFLMSTIANLNRGQGLVEYALILTLVALVVIAVLMILGPRIGNVFSSINKSLSSI